MSSNHDVEAAILNNGPRINFNSKFDAVEMEKSTNARRESDENNSSREKQIDEHMHFMDQPLAPLLETDKNYGNAPLAESEIDDLGRPGVNGHPALNNGPLRHEDNDKFHGDDKVDTAGRHDGGGDGLSDRTARAHDENDDINGSHLGIDGRFGNRPISAMEIDHRIIPDVNVYQQKKNLAQGMMDLALLSANANQLRYVIESSAIHPYYWPSLIFISMSIIFQILVGIGLIMNSAYNVKNEDDICKADKINNFTVLGIFLVTIINVFVSAFGVAGVEQRVQSGVS